jgi:hypothetical protein
MLLLRFVPFGQIHSFSETGMLLAFLLMSVGLSVEG